MMAAVAMLGVLLGRRPRAWRSSRSPSRSCSSPIRGSRRRSGFALSSVATASLLLFARPLAAGLSRALPRALALALSVPLAAQLACGPLLVLITPGVPVYGVLANLLAEPAAPVATLVGLAACLAAPVPALQDGLAALAWVPASWIAATAQTVTAIPGDLLPWIEGWPGAALLAGVGLAVGALVVVTPGGRRRERVIRGVSMVLVALIVGVSAGGVALTSVAGRWTLPASWSVLACDVGQGDAVLLRSRGAVMLVDTGPDPAPLAACLERVGHRARRPARADALRPGSRRGSGGRPGSRGHRAARTRVRAGRPPAGRISSAAAPGSSTPTPGLKGPSERPGGA